MFVLSPDPFLQYIKNLYYVVISPANSTALTSSLEFLRLLSRKLPLLSPLVTEDSFPLQSGSGDKAARIGDMIDGTSKVLTISNGDSLNGDAGVTSVAISPNGHFVAAGSLDTVVRIWDVATAQLVET